MVCVWCYFCHSLHMFGKSYIAVLYCVFLTHTLLNARLIQLLCDGRHNRQHFSISYIQNKMHLYGNCVANIASAWILQTHTSTVYCAFSLYLSMCVRLSVKIMWTLTRVARKTVRRLYLKPIFLNCFIGFSADLKILFCQLIWNWI